MKTKTLLTTAILLAGSLVSSQAEPADDLKAAVKKLSEKGNYSWTSTTKRPERPEGNNNNRRNSGPTNGKTADGAIHMSRTFGDRSSESLVKGEVAAVKRDDSWSVLKEAADDADQSQRRRGGYRRMLVGYKAPAAQAEELLGQVAVLKLADGVYSGALTEEGAKSLIFGGFRRGGGGDANRPEPKGLKASAKFWVKDGVLTKFETSLEGKITWNENERDLSRVSTVEIKEVGSTKIDIPKEVSKEFSGGKKKDAAKPADEKKRPAVEEKKPAIEEKKPAIEEKKPAID